MSYCGATYHLVGPKLDKHRQNPQDTCSKNPGRVFSEGAEPPEAGHHPSHSSGELPHIATQNDNSKFQLHFLEIFKYAYAHIPCAKSEYRAV